MLQECHLLAPPGIINEELSGRYDAILRQLASWITKVDVVLHGLELLAMLADKDIVKTRAVKMDSDTELIPICIRITTVHNSSKPIQRAALQLFEAIIQHAAPKSLPLLAERIFKVVLDNLLLHADDNAIVFSSFCILLRLASDSKSLILPYTDQLINICIEDAIVRRSSPEIAAKGVAFLAYLTEDRESYFTIARHPNGFQLFIDGLDMMRAAHLTATITLFELLLRMLEDYDVALEAFQNLPLSPTGEMMNAVEFAREFQAHMKNKFERYLTYTTDLGDTAEEEEQMKVLMFLYAQVDELLMEMMRPEEDAEEMVVQLKKDSKQQHPQHDAASPEKPGSEVTVVAENVTPAFPKPILPPAPPAASSTSSTDSHAATSNPASIQTAPATSEMTVALPSVAGNNGKEPLTLTDKKNVLLEQIMAHEEHVLDAKVRRKHRQESAVLEMLQQELHPVEDISDSDDDSGSEDGEGNGDNDGNEDNEAAGEVEPKSAKKARKARKQRAETRAGSYVDMFDVYENRADETMVFSETNRHRNDLAASQTVPTFLSGIGRSMSAESMISTRSMRLEAGIDLMALDEDEKQEEAELDSSVPSSGLSAKELVQLSKELNMQELTKQQQDLYMQDAEQQQALRAQYEHEHVNQFG